MGQGLAQESGAGRGGTTGVAGNGRSSELELKPLCQAPCNALFLGHISAVATLDELSNGSCTQRFDTSLFINLSVAYEFLFGWLLCLIVPSVDVIRMLGF